jgi:O-antigen/teichoic acid export membrane protein
VKLIDSERTRSLQAASHIKSSITVALESFIAAVVSEWMSRLNSDSHAERGLRRIRRANLTGVFSIVFRSVMLLSSFFYIPATIHYLGPQRYGLWVAMTSVITLLAFADCGLGFSLMNDVAHSLGRDMGEAVRRSISSTFFVLAAIGVTGCVIFAVAYLFIPWQTLFRTHTTSETNEASRAVAVIVFGYLLTLPFTTVQRVQSAHQEGFKTQVWEIAGVLFSLVGMFVAIHLRAGLPVLVIVFSTGPLLAILFNWLFYFFFNHPAELPSLQCFDRRLAVKIANEGGYFFILQIAGVVIFSTDGFIVLHYFGQTEFAKYSLLAKLFQVAPALASVWFAALWPAYSEAIARGDLNWVRRTLVRSTILSTGGCGIASAFAAICASPIIYFWAQIEVHPSTGLLLGWIVYWCVVTGSASLSAYLNASQFVRGQAILVTVQAASSIFFKLMLCRYGDISGVVWGTIAAYVLVVIPVYSVIFPRLNSKQTSMALARSGAASSGATERICDWPT